MTTTHRTTEPTEQDDQDLTMVKWASVFEHTRQGSREATAIQTKSGERVRAVVANPPTKTVTIVFENKYGRTEHQGSRVAVLLDNGDYWKLVGEHFQPIEKPVAIDPRDEIAKVSVNVLASNRDVRVLSWELWNPTTKRLVATFYEKDAAQLFGTLDNSYEVVEVDGYKRTNVTL